MKKELIFLLVFALVFSAASVNAQTAATTTKINLAYNWLANAVSTWPSSTEDSSLALLALSYDDRIASLGRSELFSKSNANECWPSICRIKPTALAVLALNNLKENMETADSWLIEQQKSFTDTEAAWYLQIDSAESANCSISYDGSYSISLDENKKLSNSAGSCLALTSDKYWLSISKSNECLDKTYSITCDNDFVSSIFYTKGGTLYVPSETFSASSGNSVDAKIQSVCLAESGQCSYEGTLWAAFALKKENKEAGQLLPYLLAQKDAKFMPDALLYLATDNSEYAENLITSQNADGSWTIAGTPYSTVYDTALASLALKKYYSAANTDKAEAWMLGQQNADGSFGTLNKVRDTAIVLYALWPKEAATLGNECENQGYSCKSFCSAGEEEETFYSGSCLAGVCCKPSTGETCEVLSDCLKRACDGEIVKNDFGITGACEYMTEVTCYDGFDNDANGLTDNDDPSCRSENSCDELAGTICSSSEICQGGEMRITSDTEYCCVYGVCAQGLETCAEQGGDICSSEESCSNFIKASDTSFCCSKECGKKGGLWWLVILLVAAIAVVLFLLYKKGIIKFGGKPKSSGPGPGGFPPSYPATFPPAGASKPQPAAQQPSMQIQKQPMGLFRRPLSAKPRKKTSKEEELEAAFKELKRISE